MSCFARRTSVVAAFAALAVLPAAAAPPPPAKSRQAISVETAPLAARLDGKRYKLRVVVTRTIKPLSTSLALTFSRVVGSASQVHEYEFALPRRAFSCSARLGSCRLATGSSLRRFGRLDLSFTATGRPARGTVAAGCTGTASRRSGKAEGEIRFVDRSVSLRAAARYSRRTRLPASVQRATMACAAETVCHRRILGLGGSDPGSFFALVAPATGAAEAQFLSSPMLATTAPATVRRTIVVRNVPSRSLTIAPDLSSARFDATGLRFLSGTVSYNASRPVTQFSNACGQGEATLGGVTGDVAALFDGIGRRPLAATGGYLQSLP